MLPPPRLMLPGWAAFVLNQTKCYAYRPKHVGFFFFLLKKLFSFYFHKPWWIQLQTCLYVRLFQKILSWTVSHRDQICEKLRILLWFISASELGNPSSFEVGLLDVSLTIDLLLQALGFGLIFAGSGLCLFLLLQYISQSSKKAFYLNILF